MTKWKLVPVEPDEPTLSAMHEKMYDVRGMQWHDGMLAVYIAGVNAAPQPPRLSDERILEIYASESGRPVTMGKARIIAQARAIEREILGGEHE